MVGGGLPLTPARAELEEARRQVDASEAATDELEREQEAAAAEAARRPWWRFWG
jgi:hypothetical protein